MFLPRVFSLLLLLFSLISRVCGELSNPTSFCCGTTAVQDDAAPGTQEYIMLRQDSIHSADIRSKGSPFRAKCHEIFCCPLKQAVHKESAEPEGLSATPLCFLICRCSSYPSAPLPSCFSRPPPYKVLFHFCPIGEHLVCLPLYSMCVRART